MSVPTEEELEAIQAENEKLRSQIDKANSKRAETEAETERAIRGANLAAENARLQAQLAQATEAAKVGVVREGSAGLLTTLVEQVEQANAVADAPVGPVDTNDPNPPKNTTGESGDPNPDAGKSDKTGGSN